MQSLHITADPAGESCSADKEQNRDLALQKMPKPQLKQIGAPERSRRHTYAVAAMLGLQMCLPRLTAQEAPVAFVGAQVITITGEAFDKGVLIVDKGKIVAVGSAEKITIPDGAKRRNVSGKIIMPGLVDTHSHVGGGGAGDRSAPIQPDVRVMDSIDVRDPSFQKAQAGGITTANVMPGSGHLISGQTVYLKFRDGKTIEDLSIKTAEGRVAGGLKMANGTNSRRDPPFPGTRGKSAALVREQYVKAQEYRDKIERAKGDPDKMPARDLGLEILVEALNGQRMVHHHTHNSRGAGATHCDC